ncbi:MAG: Uncharacterized protein LiPW30_326 [Parcubacteria group bacterium LiPW_30]|nr:MAG: Uncharacterized protein LiPW30_326 [Parcubacteria group bacterium LiPW_30]
MLDQETLTRLGKGDEINYLNLEYFFNLIYQGLNNIYLLLSGGIPGVSFSEIFLTLKNILQILIVFLIVGIVYCFLRLREIRKEQNDKLTIIEIKDDGEKIRNERWAIVQDHLNSDNEADWKFAVIEADNILDELVRKMGYDGEDLGERLKAVEPSDFQSLQSAWEAHKVRNQIVHESSGFKLTYAETKRIIGLYEQVFREFEYL